MPSTASPTSASAARTAEEAAKASAQLGSTWATALRLLRFSFGVAPRAFAFTVAIALAGSLTEGLGLVLLLPLLSAAGMNFTGSSTASRLAAISQRMLIGAAVPHWLWLPVVLAIFLATGALRSVLRRSQTTIAFATTMRVELALSRRVYESVINAQWGFLVRQRSGRLTHLLTGELRRVTDAISVLLSLINLGCLTLLYLALALKLSAPMTLLVLLIGGALLLLQRRSLDRMRASGEEFSQGVGEVYAATEEHLLNLKTVKTYNAEDRDAQLFADLCATVAGHAASNAKHQAASAFRFEVGSLVALGAVVYLALGVLHVQAANMLLLLAIFTRLMPQLATLQSLTHIVASTLPSFDNVLAIEAECAAHAEPKSSGASSPSPQLKLERELRLDDVWFAYQPSGRELEPQFVLRGIDLTVEARTLTAVIGPSGAGKSTLADLVNGLLSPTRGRLLLDGSELNPEQLRQWRREVGYVGQETVLFHMNVRENLLWAQPHATEDELHNALLLASAGFVYELPRGLDTVVGDRGIMLSSGQRQRISLARALLRKPTLLILDEATNALDVENEASVLNALQEATRGASSRRDPLTVLMIAHRPSAIRRADRILLLEDGRIAPAGTWEELNSETHP